MKVSRFILFLGLSILISACQSQDGYQPDLGDVNNSGLWTAFNRSVSGGPEVHLDAQPRSGFIRLNDYSFDSGVIEFEVKGKDEQGKSFVGMAFHGVNDSTYDAVYFRPFNFNNPERNTHSVQYISHPENTWRYLRENYPGEYENVLNKVPDPNDWFKVKIEVANHKVLVYVEDQEEPALMVNQISHHHGGWIGFWVGHGSEGWFRNLVIHRPEE